MTVAVALTDLAVTSLDEHLALLVDGDVPPANRRQIKVQASCVATGQSSITGVEPTASVSGGISCALRVWPFCKMPTATK